ncbi:dihydropteroate synthase [Methylobacillus methanolivorans]|uniref:Dihydropteroate synthase n=1 Tax=Methylobacillus methanolivorans TaxID=1848927 RepID=A0ABW8GK46_9PROT
MSKNNSNQFMCGKYQLDLAHPHVMGIVNVTPDSFSDGGRYASTEKAVAHAVQLVADGAHILDIGGESTRPNATPVGLEEELERVIPVIERLAREVDVPLSIDTYKPQVMSAAVKAGAAIINDIRGLQEPGAVEVAAEGDAGICIMHMQGTPQTMQQNPVYEDVVQEVATFLSERLQACMAAGIKAERIVLDPGFGFGKRTVHNLALLNGLPDILALGRPLLVGLSRKSVLGQIVGSDVDQRLHASLAASVISVMKGGRIVRVHDVKATVDALKVVDAVIHA